MIHRKLSSKNVASSALNTERFAGSGIILCAILVISYCIWMLDRGFGLTDEAYYLLLALHGNSFDSFISAEHWITSGLWKITGSIVLYRAIGMFLLLASAAILAIGVYSVGLRLELIEDRFKSKCLVIAGSIICALLYASTINLSPCYNLLASAGAYAASGMALLATTRANFKHKYSLVFLSGCALGIEILVKASAGFTTMMVLMFWGALFERSYFHKIMGPLVMLCAAAIFICSALLVNTTLNEAMESVEQGLFLFRMVQVETITSRLIRYFVEYWEYFLMIVRVYWIPILGMIGWVVTRRIIYVIIGLSTLLLIQLFGSIVSSWYSLSFKFNIFDGFLIGGSGKYVAQIVAIGAILLILLIISVAIWSKNRYILALFAGLVFLPYTVANGTGNALFTQIIDSLAPWGVVISMLFIAKYPKNLPKTPVYLIGFCFMATVASQITTSSQYPYQMSAPLTKQSQAIALVGLGDVRVDGEVQKFITQLKETVENCSIKAGTPFIGLYNIPGVALVLQTIPLSLPWLNNKAQAEFIFGRKNISKLQSYVVALRMIGGVSFPPIPQQLKGFPDHFKYCGAAVYPYNKQKIKIWHSSVL